MRTLNVANDRPKMRRDSFPPSPVRLSGDQEHPAASAAQQGAVKNHGQDARATGKDRQDAYTTCEAAHAPDFWSRACQLLVLLILVLIPCLYPLRLPNGFIQAIRNHAGAWWYGLYVTQLDTFINYGYSPLPLKEGAFTVLVVLLFLCWYIRQICRAWSVARAGSGTFDWRIYGPIVALLVWGAISLIYTPTLYWSLTTHGLMTAGLLWFIVVYQMPKNPRLLRRWFNAILLAGGIVALFAFLQDADRGRWITGLLFVDIEEAARSDVTLLRLRMGSLIGHNIGVAGLISFSWFILLSRLFQPVPWKRKIGWAALFVLFFYVVVAAQTRGVWIVLATLTPCHLLWLMRITGKRFDLRPILAVILVILIILTLQIVPSPRNPFYSPESPLLIRFTHFSPSHLLTETRLRIAVCSGSLLTDRPLLGHGLGSFQYVFPPAQADYFATHPNTLLAPSPNRTVQAHSDWLQLLIELGLPGLLIVLVGLYFALRRGWDSWAGLRNPSLRLEMTAPLMGVAGVMIHALADFPIHVVSTSANVIFLLAVWASCGRESEVAAEPSHGRRLKNKLTRSLAQPAIASRIVATSALVLVIPSAIAAAVWYYSLLHASMYESLGTSYRIYYGDRYNEMSDSDRKYVINEAYRILRRGQKVAPLDCQIAFRLGETATLYGVLDVTEAEQARSASDPTSRVVEVARRKDADLRLLQAIHWLEVCQAEVRYHEVFHYLGMAYEHLFRLHGGENDRQKAKLYYRLAVRYSPCFSRSLYRLFLMLQKDTPPNVAEMRDVCRQIARYDPPMYQRQFTQPVMKAIERCDFKQAAAKIDVLLDVQPEQTQLWLIKVHLLACTDRGREAEAFLTEFTRMFPEFPSDLLLGYRAEAAMACGRYEEATHLATATLKLPAPEGIALYHRILRAAALEKLNRPEAKSEWAEMAQIAGTNQQYQIAAANVFLFVMRDAERAYPYLVKSCQSDSPAPPAFFRIASDMSFKRGEKEQGLKFLERALALDPEDPLTQELLKTARP